jgi:glycerol-3-phosphate dehydrogenase
MRRDLAALANVEHDLLIVGGGICGAAAAWDAAQRGLRVALVERGDFGSGTSWNSLKTIHGGLRHLQRADVQNLRESARERAAWLRIAPGLVRPLPFLVPTYGHGRRGREALALGLRLNDLLTRDRNAGLPEDRQIPDSEMLSPEEVRARVPGIVDRRLTGGALWWDAQVTSSERLLLALLHAATAAGATLVNYAEVLRVRADRGRVTGVSVLDAETSGRIEVRARLVLNAAGPGAVAVLRTSELRSPRVPLLRAWNVVLGRQPLEGVAVGGGTDTRYLFLVPWRDRSIVGTAYAPAESEAAPEEAEAFLAEAARAFPWAGLPAAGIRLVHRGWVPGRGSASRLWMRPVVVDHESRDRLPGLITVVGVKYTTARALAERAVDLTLRRLRRAAVPSRTAHTPLPVPAEGTLVDRTRRAVREEMALHLDDAILRRLDLGTTGQPSAQDVEHVSAAMAGELGWAAERVRSEVSRVEAAYQGATIGPNS